jgi:hypothetical protein
MLRFRFRLDVGVCVTTSRSELKRLLVKAVMVHREDERAPNGRGSAPNVRQTPFGVKRSVSGEPGACRCTPNASLVQRHSRATQTPRKHSTERASVPEATGSLWQRSRELASARERRTRTGARTTRGCMSPTLHDASARSLEPRLAADHDLRCRDEREAVAIAPRPSPGPSATSCET